MKLLGLLAFLALVAVAVLVWTHFNKFERKRKAQLEQNIKTFESLQQAHWDLGIACVTYQDVYPEMCAIVRDN